MKKAATKKAIRQRSAWLASMFGCAAFLLMAVKLYNVSVSSLLSNLLTALLIDRVGRRPPLLLGLVGIAITMGTFAATDEPQHAPTRRPSFGRARRPRHLRLS